MPEVSVVIPLYNGKKYILDTVESVLRQTYNDYEIIVVDDGSTDGSVEILLSRYKERVNCIRQPNSGISAARNAAIRSARGKFIAFLDHDDKWLPDKLEKQMGLFARNPQLGLVYSDSFIIDGADNRCGTFFGTEKPGRGYAFNELLKANFIPILSAVVKKEALEEVGLFDIGFSIAEDWELFLRVLKKYPADYIDEPLAEYRVHGDSFSRRRILMLREVNQIADLYSKDGLMRNEVKKIVSGHRISLGLAYLSQLDRDNARRLFKDALMRGGRTFKSLIGMALSYFPVSLLRRIPAVTATGVGFHETLLYRAEKGKVRVLYVIDTSDIGGTGIQTMRLLKHLDHEKFDVFIACPAGGELVKSYRQYAKRVYELDVKSFFSVSAIRKVVDIIDKEDIDIVHSKLFTSDFCAAVAAIIKKRVFVSTIVGFNFYYLKGNAAEKIKKAFESYMYRAVYSAAKKVIAVSSAVKNDLALRPGIKVDSGKIGVVYCGVPEAKVVDTKKTKEKYAITISDRVICCVASLFYVKGQIYLLRSMPSILKRFPTTKLFLVGDGSERQSLEKEAGSIGISANVVFTGNLCEEKKNEVLSLSEIVVLPSLSEGCPQIILEAMSLAKPVVATNVGGIPELVNDGSSGLLVDPKNPEALSGALLTFLSDRQLAGKMGVSGRSIYEDSFSVENMVLSTAQIYLDLFANKGRQNSLPTAA